MLKWLHVLIYLNKIIKFNSFSYLLIDFIIEMYQSGPNGPKCYVDAAKVTIYATLFFFFFREFQPIASAPDNSSLSLDQDINQFLV